MTIAYSNAGRDRVAKDERASVALVSDRIRRRFDVPTPLPKCQKTAILGHENGYASIDLEETHGQTEEWHPLGDRLPVLRRRR